jgi:predicted nucleotidyltransferase
MESARFTPLLRYHLEGGIPFPEARQKAVSEITGIKTAALLENANNTLGMEYMKALRRLNSPMAPFTVQRFGAEHDARAPMGDMASASYIRTLVQADRLLNASPFIPTASLTILNDAAQEGRCPASPIVIERAVLAKLRTLSRTELAALPGISEGLENRIYEAVRQAGSLAELMERIKTKRYPLTRIQRIIWSAFIGITAGYEKQKPPYIRVLGANERGIEILGAARELQLPILSRPAQLQKLDGAAKQVWEWESRAADLYALALPTPLPCGIEYTTGMIR